MRSFRTEGIIIKRRNINEADRILTVMTREYGKLQVKAVGVRKITSRRGAHVELLNHTMLHVYKGRIFLLLTEANMLDDYSSIKDNFEKVGLAYHLCELVDGLCPENEENYRVFSLLQNALSQLSACKVVSQIPSAIEEYSLGTFGIEETVSSMDVYNRILHTFELSLLSELGFWDRQIETAEHFDTHAIIENILERKLKSHSIFSKLY